MMSRFLAVLAALLLFGLWASDVDGKSVIHQSSNCCYQFVKRNISHLVRSYKLTASSCPHKAVRFTLKGGKTFCGSFQDVWVQKYVMEAEAKKK
ncbi:C-C motif chemokine 1-like [Tachyglossus aculeatus]|uniref:C-C motif chemokine 1-like n=1 Tax=Tachyglossus aculeatus TaxID=9261 RepID=UPI0018F29DCF|nr:C-C motif chemokine 1-like [Tachyglossus aculeatus]